ncbi:MAG: THUMP domain-containing protein [Desulfosalsimonadaceae bacterium]
MTILRKKADRAKQPFPLKYLYQKKYRFFAQVSDSLKDAAIQELKHLGAADISPSFRGIYFTTAKEGLYRITYTSRLISRVLAPLVVFDCFNTDALYKHARQFQWDDFFDEDHTFAVFSNIVDSRIIHSKFAALRMKDGIVDYFLEHKGKRPNVSPIDPDIGINLHIHKNIATVSMDVSGGALHRRGYREESVSAPMQETAAAGIIRMTGWNGKVPLVDPMCGSGTLLCEALMHYCRIPAGIFRKTFGFEHLPDFSPETWKRVRESADGNIREMPQGLISGSDMAGAAVNAARTNLMGLHYGNRVEIIQSDFKDLPGLKNRVIVINPPYGIRMGRDMDMPAFYRDLGDFLKQKCTGSTAYIYFGDPGYIGKVGLKAAWKKPLMSGGLDGRLVKFELF